MKIQIRLLLLGLTLIGLWLYARGCDRHVDNKISSTTLPANIAEKIIVNPEKHTLTIVHPSGDSQTLFLPDRPSAISITKGNKVQIAVRAFGTEISPSIGFAYADIARLSLGLSLAYWHKWEVGINVYPSISGAFSVRLGPVLSYNVYQNTSLFLGVTNQLQPIGGISLKF